jgi:hypothetical protein
VGKQHSPSPCFAHGTGTLPNTLSELNRIFHGGLLPITLFWIALTNAKQCENADCYIQAEMVPGILPLILFPPPHSAYAYTTFPNESLSLHVSLCFSRFTFKMPFDARLMLDAWDLFAISSMQVPSLLHAPSMSLDPTHRDKHLGPILFSSLNQVTLSRHVLSISPFR